MEISPAQQRQVNALLTRLTRHIPRPNYSAADGLILLGALNVPLAIHQAAIKHRCSRIAEEQWRNSFIPKVTSFFSGKTGSEGFEAYRNDVVHSNMVPLFSRYALTRQSLQGVWWTPITSSFLHLDLEHLLGNMAAYVGVAPICAKVPGMTALHAFSVAIGTSLLTGGVTLLRLSRIPPFSRHYPVSCGFSAIVCAFTSVAALGFTGTQAQVFGSYRINVNSLWITMLSQIAWDVFRMVQQSSQHGPAWLSGSQKRVDCVGHLVGAGFGALYYYVFLRKYKLLGNRLGGRPL